MRGHRELQAQDLIVGAVGEEVRALTDRLHQNRLNSTNPITRARALSEDAARKVVEPVKPEPVKVITAPPRTPGVLTVEEAAHYLGVTPDQIRGFVADGVLRYINLGRGKKRPRIGFTIPDLDDFIEHRRQRAVAPCPSSKSKSRRSTNTSSSGTVIGFTARRNARLDEKRKR